MPDEITVKSGSHLRGLRGWAGESKLRPRLVAKDCTTRYYQRVRDDGYVTGIVVWNPVGEIVCFTDGPNGDRHLWGCRHTGVDEITFFPHPAYVHTMICTDCRGEKVLGIDPVTNPMGSKCQNCEGSGEQPIPVCLVFEHGVNAERMYLEPTKTYSFLSSPILSGV